MHLKNKSRTTLLSDDCKIASSLTDRTLGLLRPSNPKALIFITHFGIHTFFLTKPIDILVLNKKWEVVKKAENLPPYRFFFYNPVYSTVIELPGGTLKRSGTSLSDKIYIA